MKFLFFLTLALVVVHQWLAPLGATGSGFNCLVEEVRTAASGTSPAPFGHRVLVPWLFVAWNRVTGISLALSIVWFQVLCCAAGFYAMYHLVRGKIPQWAALIAPLASAPLLVWMFSVPRYSHEFAVFALTAASLAAIRRERWLIYGFLFVAGLLTRETAVLLCAAVFAVKWKETGTLRLVGVTLVQLLAFVGIKVALSLWHSIPEALYATGLDLPAGSVFYFTVAKNIRFFAGNWIPNHRFVDPDWLLFYGLLAVCLWRWSKKERFFRRSVWHPISLAAGMLLVGRVIESRIFIETVPWLAAMFALSVSEIVKVIFPYKTSIPTGKFTE